MLFQKKLPKHADIFTQTKHSKFFNIYYKSFGEYKIVGIITACVVIFFGAVSLLLSSGHINKVLAPHVSQAETANGATPWGGHNDNDWQQQYDNQNNNPNYSNQQFTPFPQNNFAVNNTPFTPIQPQYQTISTNTTPDITQEPNLNPTAINQQPPSQDIGGISTQIIQVQQQIAGTMQGCVNNANNMVNQINGLISQQKNLQQQLDAVNNQQMPNFDTSTPQGQQQQQAWQQQQQDKQQKLQQAIDALSNTINTDEGNMSTANNNCSQNVGQLEQNRGQLEGNLDQAFNNAMNVQVQQ